MMMMMTTMYQMNDVFLNFHIHVEIMMYEQCGCICYCFGKRIMHIISILFIVAHIISM